MKDYKTTKEQCQEQIDKNSYVCSRCGRNIVPIETVDNSGDPTYWSGCMHGATDKNAWGHFDNGVSKEVFELAEKLVCDGERAYSHSDKSENKTPGEKLSWFETQVSGMCGKVMKMEYLKNNSPHKTKQEFLEDKYF